MVKPCSKFLVSSEGERISVQDSFVNILRLNESLLGDENTVEEFTFVLASNSADLLDLGASEGECLVVNTIEDQLTLLLSGDCDLGVTSALDEFVLFTTKEVLDSDACAVLGDHNIDGEMSVHKSHLVAEALLESNEYAS